MASVEMSDTVHAGDIDVRVLPAGQQDSSSGGTNAAHPAPHMRPQAGSHERQIHSPPAGFRSHDNLPDDEYMDESDLELPPIKVKEALTYSLAITSAHEIAGTFAFVYSILAVATNGATTTDVAFAIAAAAFVYSHVFNKAHFNTWITVYLYLTDLLGRRFDAELIELYPEQYRGVTGIPRDSKRSVRFMSGVHIVCQLIGATLAARLVYSFPLASSNNLGNIMVTATFMDSEGVSPNAKGIFVAMLLEFLITYALLYSLDIGDESNHRPGRSKAVFFSVGPPIVLFLGVRTVGDYTGASFNLARTFGPCLVTGKWHKGAIAYYAVAQFAAVLLAITVEQYRFRKHITNRRKEIQMAQELREQRRSARASKNTSRVASRRTTNNDMRH